MRAIILLLAVCLIGKDLLYAPYPNALRGIAQAACLLVGGMSLLSSVPQALFTRYWPLLGYVCGLLLTIPFSDYPWFVALQVGSLVSVIVFSMSYVESQKDMEPSVLLRSIVMPIIIMYFLSMIGSLVIAKVSPTAAYESQFLGNVAGYELRFRGLFSKAGMMGAASGLLVGFGAIRIRKPIYKIVVLVPALICLALTQSRTFWIAAVVAAIPTIWLYYPRVRKVAILSLVVIATLVAAALVLSLRVDSSKAAQFARVDTLTTLTGRTALWVEALSGIQERPVFGYGFTLGSTGLPENRSSSEGVSQTVDPTQLSRQTLHNGYIQCVMDSGLVGLFFYLSTMVVAISRVTRRDSGRKYPELMYTLVFLCIANLGESVVYSGAVFQSLCFWIFAVVALSLESVHVAIKKTVDGGEAVFAMRPANLMR
jgi:O-antigen ligase